MSANLIVVLILQYVSLSNHHVEYLKLKCQLHINKAGEKKRIKLDPYLKPSIEMNQRPK